jgi:hypothetical protein
MVERRRYREFPKLTAAEIGEIAASRMEAPLIEL